MIKTILKSKVTQNAGWLISGHVAQLVISFVVSILTARYLGPSNYGVVNYGAAYISFFSAICTLGINSVIIKELVDNRQREGMVLGTSVVLKIISGLLSCATIIAIVSIVDKNDSVVIFVTAISTLGLLINAFDVFKYWFHSHLQSKAAAIIGLIGYIVVSVYKVVLMATQQNVVWFAFSMSLDYICINAGLFFVYKKQGGQKLSFSLSYAKQLLKKSLHFVLPSLMVSIYAQTDKIMMKQMMGTEEVGFYAIAVSLASMWCFVLQAIIDSVNPMIMEFKKQNNEEEYLKKNKILYAVVFYMSLIVSVLYCLLSKPMIYILYGEAYLPAIAPLRIITWYTAFSYLGVARNAWVVCENKQRYLILLYISAAVSNVVLNILLIPRFGGMGAAVASLCAQLVSSIIAPCFIKSIRPNVKLMFEGVILKDVLPKNINAKKTKKNIRK